MLCLVLTKIQTLLSAHAFLAKGHAGTPAKCTLDTSKKFLDQSHTTNKKILEKIISSVNRGNNHLSETQKVIKEELIPAIGKENQKNRDSMNESLKMIQGGLAKTGTKVQGVIDILQKSFNTQKILEEMEKLNTD